MNPLWPKLVIFIEKGFPFLLLICVIIVTICAILNKVKKTAEIYNTLRTFLGTILICVAGLFAFLFLIISIFAPQQLAIYPLNLSETSNLATSINGFMNPFIAIAAAILTFMAFWVQFNANQSIYRENKKQQDERQFYEMLKIHRDNVDKMEFKYYALTQDTLTTQTQLRTQTSNSQESTYSYTSLKGQNAIQYYLKEFKIIYKHCPIQNERFKKAYEVFFEGLDNSSSCSENEKQALHQARINIFSGSHEDQMPQCYLMQNHKHFLNPYYRHLYLTVKSIVNSNFNTKEKEQFLKILRASLTAEEQILLLFNWYYGVLKGKGYGIKWEDKEQKYFTKWKMIHNITLEDLDGINEMDSFLKIGKLLYYTDADVDSKKLSDLFEEYN